MYVIFRVLIGEEEAYLREAFGEAYIEYAEEVNARIIVMGAYGHSRFREAILGGATRHMLADAKTPVLMAH